MADKQQDKRVLFQGTGYRIIEQPGNNVMLEKQREKDEYQLVGYYTSILKALRAVVLRDVLNDKEIVHSLQTYIKQIEAQREVILSDISNQLESSKTEEIADDEFF